MYLSRKYLKRALFGPRTINYHPAEIVSYGIDSISGYTLGRVFRLHYDINAIYNTHIYKFEPFNDKSIETYTNGLNSYKNHMVSLKKCIYLINNEVNDRIKNYTIGIFAGSGICYLSFMLSSVSTYKRKY
mgnify:CR=1 FL=1|jgi:hypothetical protein